MKHLSRYIIALLFSFTLLPSVLQAQRDEYEIHQDESEEEEREESGEAALSLYAQGMFYNYHSEGEHQTPKSRELYFYGLRAYPFGKIPQNARLTALGRTEKMPHYGEGISVLADNSWKQIGPFDVGGRVRSIVVHPTDGKTLWIGAADGGVWKSTDRGESWSPKMDNTNAIAMGALALDPSNPNILYAGTGEMSSNVDAYNGAGIFKSEDGGETWHVLGLTNVGAFSRIIVHPTNGNIIWAAATKNNGGFYKSIDGGITWRRVLEEGVADITVNPQNPDQLWIGMMNGGIRESTDEGESFDVRNTGLGTPGTTLNRISIQVAPSSPKILYALAYEENDDDDTFSRIYKSTNSGRNWTKILDKPSFDFLANSGGSQGWYNNVLVVKPDDPNVVVAGGVTMVRTGTGDSVWTYTGSGVHADHHAMAFDPTDPNRLYDGNDGGMYRSEDAGLSFTKISTGLAITQFYDLAVDQRKENLNYGGTQDNGTLTQASTQSGDLAIGDGFYVVLDPTDSTLVYIEREYGEIYRLEAGGAGGFRITLTIPSGELYAPWSAPMALDPADSNRLYSGRHKLYVNRNARGNENWETISPEIPGFVSAIGISQIDSRTIFIGSAQGVVMKTTNKGDSWTDLTFGHGLPNRAVTDFAFSPTDPQTVYLAYSGFFTEHIYKTTDGGDHWLSISRGLPDIPVNAIALHPDDEKVIFAGTDIGMFISLDGGETWRVYNNGMPRVSVVDLEVHLSSRTLRAATHGRSMFEIGIGGALPQTPPSITAPAGGEVWVGGTPNVIAWGGFNDLQGVRLEYSLDDGRNWRRLGEHLDGSPFRWNTVNSTSIVARVRVTGMSDSTQRAVSNTFTIRKFGQGAILQIDSKPTIPYGIAFDGEYLWTTDFNSNRLLKLDPATLNAVGNVSITGDPSDHLDSLFTDITYYPPRNSFFIHKLDTSVPPLTGGVLLEVAKSGEVVGIRRSRCGYPIGLAWLGTKNPDFPFLVASDRDGAQLLYFYSPDNLAFEVFSYEPAFTIANGPRGLAADSGTFWHVRTEFTKGAVTNSQVQQFNIDDDQLISPTCTIPLNSPIAAWINARGVELDDRDKGAWITDYDGNIYKIATCNTLPGPSDSGKAPDSTGSIVSGPTVPQGVLLRTNRPNPFSSGTEIAFTLPHAMNAELLVYDMNGKVVTTLAQGRFEAGTQSVQFTPQGLPAGAYRYTLLLENGGRISKMMVYLK